MVDGSIAPSVLTRVNSDAALVGSGIVGSTVTRTGGFLIPGSVGTPGSMTVTGNLALQPGAFYVVQVNPTTASNTNVSGTASLAGTVGALFAPGSFLTRSYTILTAAGGRSGTFDALATSGLPADFQASLSYPGKTAVLNLTAQLVPEPTPPTPTPTPPTPIPPTPTTPSIPSTPSTPATPPFNFTVNQIIVGRAIDNFFNNGGALPPAFLPLYGLTGSNLANALTQLDGEVAVDSEFVAFQLMNRFLNVMLDPFVDGRLGSGAGGYGGGQAMGFAPDAQTILPPEVALAYAGVLKAPQPAPFTQRWTTWGAAYGGANTTNGNAAVGSNNIAADTYGFAAGMDYHYSPDTIFGFALGGGGTNWGLANGLGSGRSDAFQSGVYGITRFGPAYVAAALAFANHWMTTSRAALGDQLTANFDAQSYGARIETGYRYAVNNVVLPGFGITPYAALQAQDFHTPSYSETNVTGGGFGLSYAAQDSTDVRTELGARFDDPAVIAGMPLLLRARVAWAHDFVSNPSLGAVFQSLPGSNFVVNGAPLPRDSALTSAGAELYLTPRLTLLVTFDGEFAQGSQTYGGSGTVRYTW
jgi:uncharacterized protein with beta-barrel porin domain